MLGSLALFTAITNARPLSHRWLMHSLDLYANTAIDAYKEGGKAGLDEFLNEIRGDSKISGTLMRDGMNLSATPVPDQAEELLERSRESKRSEFSFSTRWIGVVPKTRNGEMYCFVAEVEPVRMFGNFDAPRTHVFRICLVLMISATLCGLLARSITKPIQSLQKTAMDIAQGDLSARALPSMAGRKDELAMLAYDFDRMAERVQSLIDRQKLLLRDISHELRSPLARLSVSAELVQRGDLSAAEHMKADIKILEKMISSLLTLARIDALDKLSRTEPVHVGRLVQQIVRDASLEGSTEDKVVIQTGVFERYASADAALLHSCIENVVRNALKHTPFGGVVEVSVTDPPGPQSSFVVITTTDEGKGVPEETLEQIFDPFFRIASPESHKDGIGLGLSISKRIATFYGGRIAAQNLDGGGLQVEIQLPAKGSL